MQVPEAVIPSQQRCEQGQADKERFSLESEAYANDILPMAQGTAQRAACRMPQAYKAQVVAIAEATWRASTSVYAAYAQAPEVTRQRMYIETIDQIMLQRAAQGC